MADNSNILKDGGAWVSEIYITKLGNSFTNVADQLQYITNNYESPDSLGADDTKPNYFFGLDEKGSGSEYTRKMMNRPYHQDTRVGANDAINCLWQFNRDDDIIHPVNVTVPHVNGQEIGMGRVYAATTQYNQQICWFTFGIPYFTRLGRFYNTAFDENLISLNNNSYVPQTFKIGRIFGAIGCTFFALTILPVVIGALNRIGNHAHKYPVNRFYELRSTMSMYYDYVDSILAHWLVSTGMYGNGVSDVTAAAEHVPLALQMTGASIWDIVRRRAMIAIPEQTKADTSARSLGLLTDDGSSSHEDYYNARDDAAKYIPGMYGGSSGEVNYSSENLDAFEVHFVDKYTSGGNNATTDDTLAKETMMDLYKSVQGLPNKNDPWAPKGSNSAYTAEEVASSVSDAANQTDDFSSLVNKENIAQNIFSAEPKDWTSAFWNSALGASEFIGFRITNGTDASESFSNSTQESEFARAYNEKVSAAMHKKNDIAEGNDAAQNDDLISKIFKGTMNVIGGVLDAFNAIDPLGITDLGKALMQGAWIDIPEQYSGSDFNKSHSLTLQLRSPYGDLVSIYQSIIVPLACLLAGTLPRGAGENSYTQPFLCRVYCKGMFAIPMGIIDSLSIKRGDSEFGWNYSHLPLCIDVSLSIKDMSPIMYLSMNTSTFGELFTNDSSFNEYLRTLSGVGLFERIACSIRLKRSLQYTAHRLRNKVFNPSYWSHNISQFNVVQGVAAIVPYTNIPSN